MHVKAAAWFHERSSTWRDWPLEQSLDRKIRHGSRISLVIPARNEADTIADIVRTLRQTLVKDAPLIDELVVIDSDSTDDTAGVAARAGATVYRARDIAPEVGSRQGKGEALWKSLFVTSGDLLVFVDADLTRWGPHFVTGLLGPLLADQEVQLVRAGYTRLRTADDASVSAEGGGRLTELVARPLLSLYWPHLTGMAQPLAGEWAARRDLMESLSIPIGYGVEISTLIDTASRYGMNAVAQVHLGERAHKHRSDADIALAATELLAVVETRRNPTGMQALHPVRLHQFAPGEHDWGRAYSRPVSTEERPAAASLGGVHWTGAAVTPA